MPRAAARARRFLDFFCNRATARGTHLLAGRREPAAARARPGNRAAAPWFHPREDFIMRHPFDGINGQAPAATDGAPAAPAKYTRRSVLRTLFTAAAALLGVRAASKAEGSEGPPVTTDRLGEEGGGPQPSTAALNEEGGRPATTAAREEGGASTERLGEEGGIRPSTTAAGEEGGRPSTRAAREEGGVTTRAYREEGGLTTLMTGEEGGSLSRRLGEDGRPTALAWEEGRLTTLMVGEEGGKK
jgi:hypothetical protein